MTRGDVTKELSEKVEKKLRRQFALVAQEVWVDPDHRVDFVAFSPGSGGRNAALEHGRFVFVEVKKRGRRHACGQLEQPVIRSATDLFRATAWRTVPDLVSGPARRALVHGRADAPRVTSAQIGETERRVRALKRDRARALKRSRKAKR